MKRGLRDNPRRKITVVIRKRSKQETSSLQSNTKKEKLILIRQVRRNFKKKVAQTRVKMFRKQEDEKTSAVD